MIGVTKKILLAVLLFTGIISVNAQIESRVVTKYDGNKIMIKWFTKEFYDYPGIHVYRKESSDSTWVKLTPLPIKKGDYKIPASEYARDENMLSLSDLVMNSTRNQIEGMSLLAIAMQATLYNSYAKMLGIYFEDTTFMQGKSYIYKVTRVTTTGEKLLALSELTQTLHPDQVNPPDRISIKTSDKMVRFNWLPEEGRYFAVNIYRNSNDSTGLIKSNEFPVIISQVEDMQGKMSYPETFYLDNSVENDVQYTYELRAIDFFGDEGLASEAFAVTPTKKTPPIAPENLLATTERTSVTLQWIYSGEEKITGFNVYRSTSDPVGFLRVNNNLLEPELLTYSDTGLAPDGYYYYITSVDKHSLEGQSDKAFIEVHDYVPPAKPTNLVVKGDTGKFELTWDANTESDLMGYSIFRKTADSKNEEFHLINAQFVTEAYFTDKQSKNIKNSYIYKIVAVDSTYNKSEFSDVALGRMPDVTPPHKPHIKLISNTNNGLLIEWDKNPESDLFGYNLYRLERDKPEGKALKLNEEPVDAVQTKYEDLKAMPDISYNYYIVAVDSMNNRSESSEAYPAVYIKSSSGPVTIENITVEFLKRKKYVQVSWKVPQNADNLKGIVVSKRKEGDLVWENSGLIAKGNTYTDKKLKAESEYFFQVQSITNEGKVWKSEPVKVSVGKLRKNI